MVELQVVDNAMLHAHNGKDGNRLWICVKGLVYDVTDFNEHPGGFDKFQGVAGADATHNWQEVGHSEDAQKMMEKFLVGRLAN